MSNVYSATTPNAAEATYWNADAGANWVRYQESLDALMAGVLARLLERAAPEAGERVLDVGCGSGATALALAAAVGPQGAVLGVDISQPLLARAAERTAAAGLGHVAVLEADAQTFDFAGHGVAPGGFDLVFSRFGVMFFDDPVAAFRNLLGALRPGGRLAFVSWAEMAANPWFRESRDAAVARLGAPEPGQPRAPGAFAFVETDYVLDILDQAGFAELTAAVEPVELVHPGGPAAVADLAVNLGPAVRILRAKGGGPEDAAAIAAEIRRAFQRYVDRGTIRIPGTVNLFGASRPAG
jgi:SAM-dependent methyltransferase